MFILLREITWSVYCMIHLSKWNKTWKLFLPQGKVTVTLNDVYIIYFPQTFIHSFDQQHFLLLLVTKKRNNFCLVETCDLSTDSLWIHVSLRENEFVYLFSSCLRKNLWLGLGHRTFPQGVKSKRWKVLWLLWLMHANMYVILLRGVDGLSRR